MGDWPLSSFSTDVYSAIEQKFPFGLGRFVAPILLMLFVLAAAVFLAGVIIRPFSGLLPTTFGPIPFPPRVVAQVVGATVLIVVIGVLAWRLQAAIHRIRRDLVELWVAKSITQELVDQLVPMQHTLDDVVRRVGALEIHTDSSGLMRELRERVIRQIQEGRIPWDSPTKGDQPPST